MNKNDFINLVKPTEEMYDAAYQEIRNIRDHMGRSGALYGHAAKAVDAALEVMVNNTIIDDSVHNKILKENDALRALIANGSDDCIYCGLSKSDMGKCASGFPGCGRADDMMLGDMDDDL